MKVQPMLWRMTSPSLRTNLLVETPTLAVWGAIGLPISAPTEFRVGSSSGGMPSCAPTSAWNLPNMALVEVFEPERATPMKPSTGATMMNAVPMLEKPFASEAAMPEYLKVYASPKMKTPTRHAPHIWWKLRRSTSPSWPPFNRPIAISSTTTMIHVVRIAVPAMRGVKLKTAVTLGLAAVQVLASAEQPTAWALNKLIFVGE